MSDSDIRTFTPTEDITEPLKNGRGSVVVAHADVPMPWSRLRELGLINADGKPTVKGKTEQPSLRELAAGDTESIAVSTRTQIPKEK
jgi:hypothetical protein